MYQNIAFIGGIHGSGKGTICSQIVSKIDIQYLKASVILKWDKVSPDISNKRVESVSCNQNKLIKGLNNHVLADRFYLLDGHFCLLDSCGVQRVPESTFRHISPVIVAIKVCDTAEIKTRLENRDGKPYDYSLLEQMQNMEIEYANEIAKLMNTELITIKDNEAERLNTRIKQIFKL